MKIKMKFISLFAVLLFGVWLLVGCSGYNFYSKWTDAGATLPKDHIFTVVSLDEVQKKIESKETFALLYATTESTASVKVVTSLQTQATYLQVSDKTIFFLDAADYIETASARDEIRQKINMKDPMDSTMDDPVIMTFKEGVIDVDTSFVSKGTTQPFIRSGKVQYASLASYIFKELLV